MSYPRFAILSTGSMGTALAKALLSRHVPLTVWNRTLDKAGPLRALGAAVAPTVLEAIQASDAVIAVPHPFRALNEYLIQPPIAEALRGKRLVVMSSCESLEQPVKLLAWASAHGVDYVDAKIFGYPRDIGQPTTPLVYCGGSAAFQALEPALLALGKAMYLGEPITHASVLEAASVSWYLSTCVGFMNGLGLCKAATIPLERYAELCFSMLPGMQSYLERVVKTIVPGGNYDPEVHGTASIAGLAGVLEHFAGIFRRYGVDPALSARAIEAMNAQAQAGHGRSDLALLAEQFKA